MFIQMGMCFLFYALRSRTYQKHMYFLPYWLNKHVFPNKSKRVKKAAVEAKRREAEEGGDTSELFGDSEPEEESEVRTQVSSWAMAIVVETSESELEKQPEPDRATPIKMRTRAQTSKISKTSTASIVASPVAGMKKQTASRPRATKKPITVSLDEPLGVEMQRRARDYQNAALKELKFDHLTRKMMHYMEDDSNSADPTDVPEASEVPASQPQIPLQVFVKGSSTISPHLVSHDSLPQHSGELTPPPPLSKALGLTQASGKGLSKSPLRIVRKGDLPHPSSIFGITRISVPKHVSKRAKTFATSTFIPAPTPLAEVAPTVTIEGAREAPSASSASSLPDLVKKFGQIKTKLQSLSTSFESHSFQNARQIFKDWMKGDFTSSFSLKTLNDLEKAQYKSFLSFFENLRALRDQHQKAERVSNRVKCFQEKHVKSTAALQQLVEEGSVMEERIAVVDSEIQRLEEQLSSLKAEKVTFTNHLSQKVEEMEKISQEVEDSKT
ncbi:hypothetical protein D8674_008688 [Pyrus ussuriensis x Pyrus communis]|uniref:TMV resistance protein N-like n=1 Tax=Pyrus ussuriensis x Pyrus communis TaxID=2448454 RepID=A0A5N5HU23_9ROSA|nr:hypothetical protein D8674_008688 [Pyrus ussuriensis x Pyrus communis]